MMVAGIGRGNYNFMNSSKNRKKLCIVLAGYKQPIWEDVFDRLKASVPENIDVCVLSSGLYNEELDSLCRNNDWSYIYTRKNQLCHIQNLAIKLHPKAQWIYKIDEDIFLTKGFFEKLMEAWDYSEKELDVCPSLVAPLINVNGYSYIRLIDKLGLRDSYESRFGQAKISSGIEHHELIRTDDNFSRYMWGNDEEALRDIDRLTDTFLQEKISVSLCPVRFSIGAILFSRDFWREIKGFPERAGNGLGDDEEHISEYAVNNARPIVVCDNVVVGHLGFGPQTESMLSYYRANRELFRCKGITPLEDDLKIFVSCHKESALPSSVIYCPVEAGAVIRKTHMPDYLRDDTGENISELNYTFSELTVHYWAWKNTTLKHYGTCHYRRYFYFGDEHCTSNDHAQIEVERLTPQTSSKYKLNDSSLIRRMAEKYDLIAPLSWDVRKAPTPRGYMESVKEHMEGYGLISERDVDVLIELTEKYAPEWKDELEDYLNGYSYIGYNCFFMTKELLNEYFGKSFTILLKFSERGSFDGIQDRLCGYLGEMLFSTFVLICEKRNERVGRFPLVFFKDTGIQKGESIDDMQKKYVRFIPPTRKYLNRKFREVDKTIQNLAKRIEASKEG